MSNILKKPGWASRELISEKIRIGDVDRVIPGWGPGKEAKKYFMDKRGEMVPTGRHGSLRPVGGTSYREAELAFARYLAYSLEIAESVIATKEVKHILRDVTEARLQEKGYDSVDEWIQGWVEFAQEQFPGLDLTNVRARAERRARAAAAGGEQGEGGAAEVEDAAEDAIQDVAQEIEDEQTGEEAPAAGEAHEEMPENVKAKVMSMPVKPQHAILNDENTAWDKISFMGQDGDTIVFVRLTGVAKNPENTRALKSIKSVSAVVQNPTLASHISEIEVEKDGNSKMYKAPAAEQQVPAPAPEAEGERAPRPINLDLESTRLSTKQRTILTEQMRIARMQHLQRTEQRYM